MSYYIDIIDTTSLIDKLVIEVASAGGIALEWNGSDAKDELAIVSSQLSFDMLDVTAKDAAFIQYYTGNETRFKVQVLKSSDNGIVWQGFILPDLYSEPYKNGNLFVNFVAVDGLARLKGKYLSDQFYLTEQSIIAFYSEILKLTGLDLDLYFAPAIENFINKDWNTIYIDGETFIDKDKRKDAYSILETLLHDTLCLCYQADNRWYIEGINRRHIRKVEYKKYDFNGVFVATIEYTRVLKDVTALVTPTITIIPPYNEITITHEKTEPSFPKTLAREENDGWAIVTGVKGEVYNTDWIGHGGLYALNENPDYYTRIYNNGYFTKDGSIAYPQDDSRWISLRKKLFFAKGQVVTFNFDFNILKFRSVVSDVVNYELWKNPFKYEILLNDSVVFTNFKALVSDDENLFFEESGAVKVEFQHIVTADSLLDIRLYAPFGSLITTKIIAIEVRKATVSVVGFKDQEVIVDLINDDFTVDKEIELKFADDKSGTSTGFRLKKLNQSTSYFTEIEVSVLYGFTLSGKNYSVVSLGGANLIKENAYQVYREGFLIDVLNVIYNFNKGEQMVVETAVLYTDGVLVVKKFAVDDLLDNRTTWIQWTDAVYQIENTSYAKTVANIYRRLFNEAHEKLDCSVLNAIKFNDLISFDYVYQKNFYLLNCSWNLDSNESTITAGRSYYKNTSSTVPGDENIPPIVLACNDVYLTDLQTEVSLSASAYDPDGFVVAQQWSKFAGGFGDIIENPFSLVTNLLNLTGDYYTYQILVTDNDGATALDTVNVIRSKNYQVFLNQISSVENETEFFHEVENKYQLVVDPTIPSDFVLNVKGYLKTIFDMSRWSAFVYIVIEKNGTIIEEFLLAGDFTHPLILNYIATDIIFITMRATASAGTTSGEIYSYASVNVAVKIDTVDFINGVGTITNIPLTIAFRASIRE